MDVRKFLLAAFILCINPACEDLVVENLNDPDSKTVYTTPGKMEELAGTLIREWFFITQEYQSLGFALLAAADAGTGTSCLTVVFGQEPRRAFDNHGNYNDCFNSENYYRILYSILGSANDILRVTEKEDRNPQSATTEMARAVAWFVQGITLGYLGLVYDKAFIVTHETDLECSVEPSPYKEIILSAVSSLDQAVAISKNTSFTLPEEWLPGETWNSAEFEQLAGSFAARLLVYSARNKSDDDQTDWQRVYSYAKNGIRKDFAPLADNVKWRSYYHLYSVMPGWIQTDMYVINLMDPGMPARWPKSGQHADLPDNGRAKSPDARLETDYQYLSSCPFTPSRGYYHFSSYRYKRLDEYMKTRKGEMPEFRKAENDYLLAEAAAHTGKLEEAAGVMNASARVTRGKLAPLPADKDKILKAIHYERMVELMVSGFGIQFFQMRKEDKLQPGTPLHLPIPGAQLEVMQMEYYTFGGTTGFPGIDYSIGGW